jgi:hypothetical protein
LDIIIITTNSRPPLLNQTLASMVFNAKHGREHTITMVVDGSQCPSRLSVLECDTVICNHSKEGASASRNIGASSIPRYRRQRHVMFCDDDCYFCPGWDALLLNTMDAILASTIVSGHAHPFNLSERRTEDGIEVDVPLLISTVHMVMPWEIWDRVGYFVEPGGPGGSEDFDYCTRARKLGIGFAVTVPMCVIHTGLTSSAGKQIVGYEVMVKRNEQIIAQHGLEGKVLIQ